MAKKETKNLPAQKTQTALITPNFDSLPAEIKERLIEVKDNFESIEQFQLPRCKTTPAGFQLIEGGEILSELEAIILHTRKTNVYYAKPYNKANKPEPPTCFSQDGVVPDKSVKAPVNATCRGCPKAEFGTNQMGSGKACRNLKPIYVLMSENAVIPRQLLITPTSLRAANQYLIDLTEMGYSYRRVKTKITAYKKNDDDTFVHLKFSKASLLDDEKRTTVEALRTFWLPVMENQIVDQREVDDRAPAEVASSSGEF